MIGCPKVKPIGGLGGRDIHPGPIGAGIDNIRILRMKFKVGHGTFRASAFPHDRPDVAVVVKDVATITANKEICPGSSPYTPVTFFCPKVGC